MYKYDDGAVEHSQHIPSIDMMRMTTLTVMLMVSIVGVIHALTSKQLPGTGGTDPSCNPDTAPASDYAVSGPRSCDCSEAVGGGVGSAMASYPLISIIGVFNVGVVVECNPEQYNSTPTTCSRRSDCAPDVAYSIPGWMYDWTLQGKPIFTIDAGPGSTP